jgi:hypothetical protein
VRCMRGRARGIPLLQLCGQIAPARSNVLQHLPGRLRASLERQSQAFPGSLVAKLDGKAVGYAQSRQHRDCRTEQFGRVFVARRSMNDFRGLSFAGKKAPPK